MSEDYNDVGKINDISLQVLSKSRRLNFPLTKENYIDGIKKAGFTNIKILDEKLYMELDDSKERKEKRQITSISVKATKGQVD